MFKKISIFLVTAFLLMMSFLILSQQAKADTFVPCDPYDALCGLDCDLNGSVCGHWISDTPAVNCPDGQKQHPTAGTCIYANDSVCQSVYGAAYYDGNPVDGCACNNGAVYNSATGHCEYPVNCPDGQKEHPTAGTCIYANDAVCQSVYGAAYYDGNPVDGCSCNSGAVYSHDSGLCEYPINCPDGQKEHPTAGTCIYANDAVCQSVYGAAYYDGNPIDGCACNSDAVYNYDSGLCEYEPSCPDGQKLHPSSGNCIFANDAACRAVYGEAYYDGNEFDGCSCSDGAYYNSLTELCEFMEECPEGMKLHPDSENCIYENDAMCRAYFGEAYYDGNPIDGCACVEGAIWDGFVCVSDLEIVLDPIEFTLNADGESQYTIEARVENSAGQTKNVPMWIKIQTPNFIRPGNLDISSGREASGDSSVLATYTAPYIENQEKIEDADLIQDLIYVFATINGETTYKVITANLETQATDFNVTLTFEKDGLIERTITSTFNEGSLSGSIYFMNENNRFDLNGVKVTLDGIFPNAAQDKIYLETFSNNGTFFFENLGETGEFILDPVEMSLKTADWEFADKYKKNRDKIVSRLNKFSGDTSFLAPYNQIVTDYSKNLAEASYENAAKVVDSLKMAAYTAYFVEYYGRKADESLDNFVNYMSNVLVDTIGFVQGIVNVTNGVFDSAAGKDSMSAKVVNKWLDAKDSEAKLIQMGQKALRSVLATLREGMSYNTNSSQRVMNALQDFSGAIEQVFFNIGLNNLANYGPSQIKDAFINYMKRSYVAEMAKVTAKFSIDLNNIPDNVEAHITKAENLFKTNTEAHDYRNSLQYEWDVDTAAMNEFVNVLKPAAKVGLSIYLSNPGLANKIVDTANHAYNALKVAASANHSYEWYALYIEDFHYLEKSLAIMNSGQELAWQENFTMPIQKINEEKAFSLINIANAEMPELRESDVLYNIVSAIENNDEAALEAALSLLDEVRAANTAAREDSVEYINQYSSYLNQGNNEKATDALLANNDLDFSSEMINLRLVALSVDPTAENITSFYQYIEELAKAEDELAKLNSSAYEAISNLDKENLSNNTPIYDDEEKSFQWSDLYLLLSFLTLIIGGIISGILFKKKGRKAGFIAVGITMLLVLIFLALTGAAFESETLI